MSLKWPNKDPDETLDYSIDWSRFLGSATISNFVWFVSSTNTNTVVTAHIAGGTDNVKYKFTCRITDSNGLVVERTVFLRVREK